ncbi:hypothetical protein LTS07_003269 [Exophiala sideris]|nr:hypothetical protein LTS07_003269 [Exophiala sideris]KAK5042646.1 hypothetical protein LTR13_001493 [Exophiala sideris]
MGGLSLDFDEFDNSESKLWQSFDQGMSGALKSMSWPDPPTLSLRYAPKGEYSATYEKQAGMFVSVNFDPDTKTTERLSSTSHDHRPAPPVRSLSDDDNDGLTKVGMKWEQLRKNVLIRYAIYIIPVAVLLLIPIILFATIYKGKKIMSTIVTDTTTPIYSSNVTSVDAADSVTSVYNNTVITTSQEVKIPQTGGIHILGLFIWIEVVWIMLWIAKLLAQLVPILFQTVAGAIRTGIRRYALVLKAVEIPISMFFSAILSILCFPIIYTYDKPFHKAHAGKIHWLNATTGVTALYLVEKFLIQAVSVSYHGKQYYDNIKELKTLSRAIETMYDVSRHKYHDNHAAFHEEDLDIHDIRGYRKDRYGRKKNNTAESTAIFMTNLGNTADQLTSVLGYMVSDVTGKQVLMPTASGPIVEAALERPVGAEAIARRVWNSFTNFGRIHLDEASITAQLGVGREAQARYIYHKLDADENGDITLEEMVDLAKKVAEDRTSVWAGACNVKDAIKVLDRVLTVFVLILVFLIYAAFFSDYLATHYTQIWSTFTGCSFLFASTAGELFAACITVFIKHPYDVGDRINIQDKEMDVVKISLLYSVFREVDTRQMVQIPNSVINGLWIRTLLGPRN